MDRNATIKANRPMKFSMDKLVIFEDRNKDKSGDYKTK